MQKISAVIQEIQQGNEHLREEFLTSRKEFIRRYASFVCKTQLDWHNDDELSVALIAFNKAVDTFNPTAGKSSTSTSSWAALKAIAFNLSLVSLWRGEFCTRAASVRPNWGSSPFKRSIS